MILVRPETPANLGAAARAIRNTGLASLTLVSPGDWRSVESWRSAWGAHEILEQAEVFAELAPALGGCAYVAGLSRRREPGVASLDVRDMAAEIAALTAHEIAALVFGPESAGLTKGELALCGRRVYIPADPEQPSLNLSHAVMVAGYEVFRARRPPVPGPRRATHDEKERMLALLREGLRSIEALPAVGAEGHLTEWRALFQGADLTPKQLRLLEHMARKMIRRRGSPREP